MYRDISGKEINLVKGYTANFFVRVKTHSETIDSFSVSEI